jgi:hypothetical protein
MAKGKQASVDVDKLGVCARHEYLMATDQEYRDRALTPPGGLAPGEGGKEPDPIPGEDAVPAAILAAG